MTDEINKPAEGIKGSEGVQPTADTTGNNGNVETVTDGNGDSQPMQGNPTGANQSNPLEAIIAQQQAQIDALMQQNQLQNEQIVRMIQGGAQLNNNQPAAQQPAQPAQPMQQIHGNDFNPVALSSGKDVSLEGLAAEIGKDRSTH